MSLDFHGRAQRARRPVFETSQSVSKSWTNARFAIKLQMNCTPTIMTFFCTDARPAYHTYAARELDRDLPNEITAMTKLLWRSAIPHGMGERSSCLEETSVNLRSCLIEQPKRSELFAHQTRRDTIKCKKVEKVAFVWAFGSFPLLWLRLRPIRARMGIFTDKFRKRLIMRFTSRTKLNASRVISFNLSPVVYISFSAHCFASVTPKMRGSDRPTTGTWRALSSDRGLTWSKWHNVGIGKAA